MKRVVAYVLVLVILISALSVPLVLLHLAPTPTQAIPRQVDPATAPSEVSYGPGLFVFYGSVIAAIDSGNLTGVRTLLGQTGFIHVPADVSDAVNTFDSLLNSTASVLASTDSELTAANLSLSTGRTANASADVQVALSDLRTANGTITQLEAAAPLLASLTGIPSTTFVQKVNTISSLYSAYDSELEKLQGQIAGLTRLVQTSLTLSVTSKVETGSSVVATGTLVSATAGPLAARSIAVYFMGAVLGTVVTDSLGRFNASFAIPFLYQQTATMFASYIPTGEDATIYSPTSSPMVRVTLTFGSPQAQVTAPKSVYAGLPLAVNGTLSADGAPLPGYVVSLAAFGSGLSTKSSQGGTFSFQTTAPAGLGAGVYDLALTTSGNGTVGPLFQQVQVTIVKLEPALTLNVPSFAIAGLGTTISGVAEVNDTRLQGTTLLNVSPTPFVNETTSGSGTFSFKVTPPLTLTTGDWTYTLGFYPNQTWVSSARVNVTLYVINPLTLVVPVLSGVVLIIAVRRRRTPQQMESAALFEVAPPQPVPPTPQQAPSALGEIYSAALEVVQRVTSLTPEPRQTLREYLEGVRGSLRKASDFEFITLAFESDLYGPGAGPRVQEAARERLDSLRSFLEN